MQLGMIGLGRMGANIIRRVVAGGHEGVVYDHDKINDAFKDQFVQAANLAYRRYQTMLSPYYGVAWRRSVLSADRLRMVCQYDAPDAESVRKLQREAGNGFDRVWAGELIE